MRGHYGKNRHLPTPVDFWGAPMPHVGAAGSVFGHTPGDVEGELDELNNEIMQFDAELVAFKEQNHAAVAPTSDLQRLRDEQAHDVAIQQSWAPLRERVERIERSMNEPGTDADFAQRGVELRDAMAAFDRESGMSRDQRFELAQRIQKRSEQIVDLRDKQFATTNPALARFVSMWDTFKWNWMRFHSEKVSVPAQTWPLSGTWDRVQDYRQQFLAIFRKAPFQPTMTPMEVDGRRDPDLTGGIGDFFGSAGTVVKVAIYGGLALVGAVAVASIIHNVRSNKDPVREYASAMQSMGETYRRARSGG